MRSYEKANKYSKQNPTRLVEFKEVYTVRGTQQTGFLLNGERDGLFEYSRGSILLYSDMYNSTTSHVEHKSFWNDRSIASHYFIRKTIMHGEYISFRITGKVRDHHFVVNDHRMKELNYLINEPRDEAFYVTLALYGIDKEYIIGAK